MVFFCRKLCVGAMPASADGTGLDACFGATAGLVGGNVVVTLREDPEGPFAGLVTPAPASSHDRYAREKNFRSLAGWCLWTALPPDMFFVFQRSACVSHSVS